MKIGEEDKDRDDGGLYFLHRRQWQYRHHLFCRKEVIIGQTSHIMHSECSYVHHAQQMQRVPCNLFLGRKRREQQHHHVQAKQSEERVNKEKEGEHQMRAGGAFTIA